MSKILQYMENNKKVGYFGISYLDDKLRGILRGDLILLGARSGAGKSTLADMIAQHNAREGFKVHIFSLENFDGDALATKTFYYYKKHSGLHNLNLRDFASGDFDVDYDIVMRAEEDAERHFKNVGITTRKKGFNLEALINEMVNQVENNGVRLLILDHLDYVNKDNPNENDNTHMTTLMSKIRELQDTFKVAVIAISHLRKSQNTRDLPLIPSVDEFTGSSNKVRESTVVVMVAPDDEKNEEELSERKGTWFSIKKLRMGGIDNKNGLLFFDRRTGKYEPHYKEYVVRGKERIEIL